MPCKVARRELDVGGRTERRQKGFEEFDLSGGLRLRYVKHLGLSRGQVDEVSPPVV